MCRTSTWRPSSRAPQHVYHLAAQAGVRASWGREFALYTDHNVLATQRLLEAALAAGRPRIVYASSSSVYGDSPALPLREDSACHPVSPYGVTKLAAEHLGRLYERNHGLPVVSLRYFTVYGPRQRPDMAFHRFLKAARDGDAHPGLRRRRADPRLHLRRRHRGRHPRGGRHRPAGRASTTWAAASASP